MKILFLDQSGKLGGAELSLADVAGVYHDSCLVGLFADGPFRSLLAERKIPCQVLTQQTIAITKDSNVFQSILNSASLLPLVVKTARLARSYDVIYANTQKALVIGALASALTQKPLVYHLRDILSADHFSRTNRTIAITLANRFAAQVIANSQATADAFLATGGRSDLVDVVYNGFDVARYQTDPDTVRATRQSFDLSDRFVIGHFSRLSPWKGQHILLEALAYCPSDIAVVLVGDALFGEDDYANSLRTQVHSLGLTDRVRFLGFRSDIPALMAACDVVAHTSTAPEPFGRVIVEAMLCSRPVIAAAAGGAVELIEPNQTGWLCPPNDPKQLAQLMTALRESPQTTEQVALNGKASAVQKFNILQTTNAIHQLICRL